MGAELRTGVGRVLMPSDEVITQHWGNCLTRFRLAIKSISALIFVSVNRDVMNAI